jgi:hypothetical protein
MDHPNFFHPCKKPFEVGVDRRLEILEDVGAMTKEFLTADASPSGSGREGLTQAAEVSQSCIG